jgi:HK97 family phage major capsid protein
MKISDQIAELLKRRGVKCEALEELRTRVEKDARVFTAEESTAFDELTTEVKAIDAQAERLREMESIIARQATPIVSDIRVTGGNRATPPGIGFTRCVRAIMLSQGNLMQAAELSRSMFRDTPEVELALRSQMLGLHVRAAVAPAFTTDPAWAGALAAQQTLSGEIIELIRPQTIVGRLNLRKVPFNVKIARETAPIGTAGWVGQGKPKPVGKGAYDLVSIPMTKLALIVVQSEELARSSDPNSELLLRDGLINSIVKQKNIEFVSDNPPVAGVSPGGILAGLPGGQVFPSSGNTPADVQADLTHAVMLLNGGEGGDAPAWIMNPMTATWLGGLQNAIGSGAQFPTINGNRTLFGYPVIDSSTQPADEIILVDQPRILLAEDPTISIDVSREASLQMDSAPVDPAVSMVSLWQNNLIGLRGEQFTYWARANDTAVVSMGGIGYTVWPPVPPVVLGASAQSRTPLKSKE